MGWRLHRSVLIRLELYLGLVAEKKCLENKWIIKLISWVEKTKPPMEGRRT